MFWVAVVGDNDMKGREGRAIGCAEALGSGCVMEIYFTRAESHGFVDSDDL